MAEKGTQKKFRIDRIINNNVVSAFGADGLELVIMGRGIGFSHKAGQTVCQEETEKIFRIANKATRDSFKQMVEDIPLEYLQISDEVITKAKGLLGTDMNQNVYLTLTDHICFAVERFRKGMSFKNPLEDEVETFYPTEYAIGCEAVERINRKIGVQLPQEEAVPIALHLVNAEYNTQAGEILKLSQMMQQVLARIIRRCGGSETARRVVRENLSLYVKYLCLQTHCGRLLEETPGFLSKSIRSEYADEAQLCREITQYLLESTGRCLPETEQIYLILQLRRLRGCLPPECTFSEN